MMKNLTLTLIFLTSFLFSNAETAPSTSDGQRHWQIAEMYINEDAPEMAIDELEKLITIENFAPAYLKLAELYMASGNSRLMDKTEDLLNNFSQLWPEKSDELRNVIELGKARDNIRRKKFYDSIIGDWHFEKIPLNESYYALKVYRDFDGGISVDVPKECFDGDYITAWQTTYFVQWDDEGLCVNHVNSSYGEAYGIKINFIEGGTSWAYIQIYVPFNQPLIKEGKLKIKYRGKYSRGSWTEWENGVFVKD